MWSSGTLLCKHVQVLFFASMCCVFILHMLGFKFVIKDYYVFYKKLKNKIKAYYVCYCDLSLFILFCFFLSRLNERKTREQLTWFTLQRYWHICEFLFNTFSFSWSFILFSNSLASSQLCNLIYQIFYLFEGRNVDSCA